MKRVFNWQVLLGLSLIALSALVYFIHYLIFRDAHHIFIYLIGDIAFVFLEVLLVTLVLHQLLQYREKKVMLNKLNMVIGAFFSEVGGELENIRNFLKEKRQFLLNLLENPNLLEHESFTNLLWAVFHLTEELTLRRSLKELPEADYQHLAGDIKRAYHLLIVEWLYYMKHLKANYPYLFSLAVRTNPFDTNASVEVK